MIRAFGRDTALDPVCLHGVQPTLVAFPAGPHALATRGPVVPGLRSTVKYPRARYRGQSRLQGFQSSRESFFIWYLRDRYVLRGRG